MTQALVDPMEGRVVNEAYRLEKLSELEDEGKLKL